MPLSDNMTDFIERNLFRTVLIGGLIAFVGVFVYAVHLEEYNVPPPDMKTPFGSGSARAVVDGQKSGNIYNNISIQNMSAQEVGTHLGEIVAESLSFTKRDYTYNSAAMEKYFTPEGYAQYKSFLASSGLEQNLTAQNVRSGAYLELNPLQLSEGVYNGAYKWLFEVPVTISFVPASTSTYRDQGEPAQNRRFLLRAQLARVADPSNPEAVKIEIWQALPPRRAE